ncbi:MAG: L,D-transpeptidase [Bryobacteraceae bacterium]
MQTVKFLAILFAASTEILAEDAPSRRLIVNIAARKIVLVEDGKVLRMYPVAVGKHSTPSPSGSFRIASRVANPTYSQHGRVVVKPGPSNPVGTRWMGLGYKGYGIHGTNHPESIGHAASHGCIRMRNQDVEELFELVRVGDEVDLITDESTLAEVTAGTATLGGLQ